MNSLHLLLGFIIILFGFVKGEESRKHGNRWREKRGSLIPLANAKTVSQSLYKKM